MFLFLYGIRFHIDMCVRINNITIIYYFIIFSKFPERAILHE